MRCARHLEGTCTGDERFVLDRVLHCAKAVSEGILGALNGMRVGSLDEERDAFGILDVLDKGKLLLAEGVLVYETGPTKDIRCQIIHRVLGHAATDELQSYMLVSDLDGRQDLNPLYRSMLRLFARRKARMPFLARMSKLRGSIPFWLMMTKFFFFSFESTAWSHTRFLSSTIFLHFASVNFRSDSTSFSRCSAEE
jgi:hypothetical protein